MMKLFDALALNFFINNKLGKKTSLSLTHVEGEEKEYVIIIIIINNRTRKCEL